MENKDFFIVVANHCADVDTSSEVIGIFTTEALAIRAAIKSYQEGGIFSWYLKRAELDSGSCRRIESSEAEIEYALIEMGKCVSS